MTTYQVDHILDLVGTRTADVVNLAGASPLGQKFQVLWRMVGAAEPDPVRQTADDYLPRTVHWYLALAPTTRERVVAANGKTALQELREQLDLLDSKLNEIAEDLQRRDLDRLLANRRFLEERFGQQPA